jgi:hypothetical protein
MSIYTITARRANGTTFTDRICATSEANARRDFADIYRHADGLEIISIKAKEMPVRASMSHHGEI